MDKVDVLIIGGGISGLASAWWLARSGLSVEVWEANKQPGGKIMSTINVSFQLIQKTVPNRNKNMNGSRTIVLMHRMPTSTKFGSVPTREIRFPTVLSVK